MKNHLTDNLIAQLNGIYHLSAMGHEAQAREQIKILTEVLRYKMRNQNELVTLHTEAEMVKGLFSLFALRWGDDFKTAIELPANLSGEYIPHYSIMYLVENALFHAFEKQEGERMVKVSVEQEEEGLLITVEDNGCGFSPSPYNNFVREGGGGLISLENRLFTLYGDRAKISFFTRPIAGTRAELVIPGVEPATGSV